MLGDKLWVKPLPAVGTVESFIGGYSSTGGCSSNWLNDELTNITVRDIATIGVCQSIETEQYSRQLWCALRRDAPVGIWHWSSLVVLLMGYYEG